MKTNTTRLSRTIVALFALALAGCPKKEDDAAKPAGSASAATTAAASASAATSASTTAATAAPTTEPATAANEEEGPEEAEHVVPEPNGPGKHDDHDKAAATAIHKANYKTELDKLEKEDLAK